MTSTLLERLGLKVPIFQAPMAGVSSPAMAAAVSSAGGLGAIAVGAITPVQAREEIRATRAACDGPLNVNVFAHRPAIVDARKAAAWCERLAPEFAKFDAQPPAELREIYTSFLADDDMLAVLLKAHPEVVSMHFGLPRPEQVETLRAAGIVLIATATNVDEARAIEAAGFDAIVAQGWEAGGHRGMFDPDADDARLGTFALTRVLVRETSLPVIAAGGIMDGAGIRAALALGACAAQLGTAFIDTDESRASVAHRARLHGDAAHHTVMTRAISGRPARCLANEFTRVGAEVAIDEIPAYPIAYDAGKALDSAAKAQGQFGYGAQWAGQGSKLARTMSAHDLMSALIEEADLKADLEPKAISLTGQRLA